MNTTTSWPTKTREMHSLHFDSAIWTFRFGDGDIITSTDAKSEILTRAENADYEARAIRALGPECAHWLATGQAGA
jgi:hypothetical protein